MADNKKYSRISLDIAEEAEETFHVGSAGITRVDPAGSAVVNSEKAAETPKAIKVDFETEKSSSEVPVFEKKPSQSYEEDITEADLEGEVPFQKLRIAIIIVMALIVVAAVAYFNMAM